MWRNKNFIGKSKKSNVGRVPCLGNRKYFPVRPLYGITAEKFREIHDVLAEYQKQVEEVTPDLPDQTEPEMSWEEGGGNECEQNES